MEAFVSPCLIYPSPTPYSYLAYVSTVHPCSLLNFRIPFFYDKTKCKHGRLRFRLGQPTHCSATYASPGAESYGGWDDLALCNSGSKPYEWYGVWDWLENWESDDGKTLLVLGFGVLFALMVSRARRIWWAYLPFCGVVFLVVFWVALHTSVQDSVNSPEKDKPESQNLRSEHDRIQAESLSGKAIADQITGLSNVLRMLEDKISTLEKGARETLLQNDIDLDELKQSLYSLKTQQQAILKTKEGPQTILRGDADSVASLSTDMKSNPRMNAGNSQQVHAFAGGKIKLLSNDSQCRHDDYLNMQFRNKQRKLTWNGFDFVQFCRGIIQDNLVQADDESQPSEPSICVVLTNEVKTGMELSNLETGKAEIVSRSKHTVSELPIVMRRFEDVSIDLNGKLRKSIDAEHNNLTNNELAAIQEATDLASHHAEGTSGINVVSRKNILNNAPLKSFGVPLVPKVGQGKPDTRQGSSRLVESQGNKHFHDTGTNITDSVMDEATWEKSAKWRWQVCAENADRVSPEDCLTHMKTGVDYRYERQQMFDKDGSISQKFVGKEQLSIKTRRSSLDHRQVIGKRPGEEQNEDHRIKNLEGLNGSDKYARSEFQDLRNKGDVLGLSRGREHRDESFVASFRTNNEVKVKQHELLERKKAISNCSDESEIFQKFSDSLELTKAGKPQSSREHPMNKGRGSHGDGYRGWKNFSEDASLRDRTEPDHDPQTADKGTAVDNSSYSEGSDKNLSENLPLLSQNLQDEEFERYLNKGGAFLKEGKECLKGKTEVDLAEHMLYKAAELFAMASDIKPSSLVAVGQWGNSLLIHGELKLKLSQQLRSLLQSRGDSLFSNEGQKWQLDELGKAMMERKRIAATLQEVCEECEKLLVEAGRKYRIALSINRNDVRSLYNWGLALCFRAQLIAEGGEKAIKDADKIYLAAIDKFEAMMGVSQIYAPDALLNWGLALRNRSHLRPMGSKERTKLLQQARQLFQDVLKFNPNHGQAEGAISSCTSELKELEEYKLSQARRPVRMRSKIPWNRD